MFKQNVLGSWFQPSYIYLLIQQIIVASSSVWLANLILSISNGQPSLSWLWLYLISLFLPYLPGALALIEVNKAQIRSCVNYTHHFAEQYPGKILKWSDHEQRSTISSILSGEACPTINCYIEYFYHLASSGMNVLFNLIVIAVLINPSLLITYAVGVFLSFFILFFQKNIKSKLALKAQESRIQWTSLLLKAWDNILLNNLYNLRAWNNKASIQRENLIKNTVLLEKFNQFIGVLMAFALMLPSIIFIIYLAFMNLNDLPFLATLTVLFPRLFQILTYSYELLFLVSDFPVQKSKLDTVFSVFNPTSLSENNDGLLNRIQWDKISTKKEYEGINVRDLLTKAPDKGRITLFGDNGSGKTSLLLMIKNKYQNEAFYLPAKHDLLFEFEKNQFSTGQLSVKILQEISSKVKSSVILLDEWDANLDKKNREDLSLLIDKLSVNHCVIEVLHTKHEE